MGTEIDGNWLEELDYLRGMAVIAVIAQHLSGSYFMAKELSLFDISAMYLGTVASFAVPLFCVVSGFVLAHKYEKVDRPGIFYSRRARSILPQFFIFSAFYVLLMVLNGHRLSASQAIFRIVTGSSAVHLWFLVALIQFYLFFPMAIAGYNYLDARNRSVLALVACLLIQTGWQLARFLFHKFSSVLNPDQIWVIGCALDRVFLSCVFYFALGVYFRRDGRRIESIIRSVNGLYFVPLGLILSLILLAPRLSGFEQFGWVRPYVPNFLILAVIGLSFNVTAFVICFKVAETFMKARSRLGNVIEVFGVFSMGIYLIHLFFIDYLQHTLALLDVRTDTWIYYPLLFVSTCLLSLVAAQQLSRLPLQ